MKKMLIFICVLTICLTLTACDPGSYQFDYNDLTNNVVSVELIDYDNPDQKTFVSWVPDHSSNLLPFDASKLTVLETLGEDKVSDFLEKLSEAEILHKYYVYNSPKGICLKLSYDNGDFLIIWCDSKKETYAGYIGKYSAEGEVIEFIGSFSSYYSFETLVNNFFDTDL